MAAVTLCAKVYRESQLKQAERTIKSKLEGLKIELKAVGTTSRGRAQIAVSGEDEKVALRYLEEEIGLCPIQFDRVRRFSTFNGRIVDMRKSKAALQVDIGVSLPKIVDAEVPLRVLQAQLADGRKTALEKIAELFGFCDNAPMTIKILEVDGEHFEASLSESQLAQYRSWTGSLLDRLIILGASLYEIRLALHQAGLGRDIVDVEPLGLFEHAVVCKLGTDAAGLIPKIGKSLREAVFSIFDPKRILEFSDSMIA